MLSKCICQICTCGRHRCPHVKRNITKNGVGEQCKLSEYQSVYIKKPYTPKQEPITPKQRPLIEDVDGPPITTTYGDDYITHLNAPAKPIIHEQEYQWSQNESMDLKTTYTEKFNKKTGPRDRAQTFKPKYTFVIPATSFTKSTLYEKAYQQYPDAYTRMSRSQAVRPKQGLRDDREQKFDHVSTVQADYTKHDYTVRTQPIRPKAREVRDPGKFQDETTYIKEFVPKPVAKRSNRPPPEYKVTTTKFADTTTVKSDYKPHPLSKRVASFKPPNSSDWTVNNGSFQAGTTMTTDYKVHPVTKPQIPEWGKKKEALKTKEKFEDSTCYEENYRPMKDQIRVASIRPRGESQCVGDGRSAIDGVSTYTAAYITPNGVKPESFQIIEVYKPPVEKLETESIQRTHYRGEPQERAIICRPKVQQREGSRQNMVFDTCYKAMYIGEQLPKCPIESAEKDTATGAGVAVAGTFEHINTRNGHQFYRNKEE